MRHILFFIAYIFIGTVAHSQNQDKTLADVYRQIEDISEQIAILSAKESKMLSAISDKNSFASIYLLNSVCSESANIIGKIEQVEIENITLRILVEDPILLANTIGGALNFRRDHPNRDNEDFNRFASLYPQASAILALLDTANELTVACPNSLGRMLAPRDISENSILNTDGPAGLVISRVKAANSHLKRYLNTKD